MIFAVYAPQYYATAKDAAYHMYLKNLSGTADGGDPGAGGNEKGGWSSYRSPVGNQLKCQGRMK